MNLSDKLLLLGAVHVIGDMFDAIEDCKGYEEHNEAVWALEKVVGKENEHLVRNVVAWPAEKFRDQVLYPLSEEIGEDIKKNIPDLFKA